MDVELIHAVVIADDGELDDVRRLLDASLPAVRAADRDPAAGPNVVVSEVVEDDV